MEATEETKHPEGIDVADGRSDAPESTDVANEQAAAENAAESELDAARREIAELKDSWNRERADFANFRKRTIQERARAQGEAVAKFTHELLDVMDNLERVLSIKSENPEVKNYIVGVEMIRTSFVQVLQNHNIRISNPLNEPFDPMSMEAIAREDRPDFTTDTVVEVYQSGYAIETAAGEKQTLRPARVKVGVAPKTESQPARPAGGEDAAQGAAEQQ